MRNVEDVRIVESEDGNNGQLLAVTAIEGEGGFGVYYGDHYYSTQDSDEPIPAKVRQYVPKSISFAVGLEPLKAAISLMRNHAAVEQVTLDAYWRQIVPRNEQDPQFEVTSLTLSSLFGAADLLGISVRAEVDGEVFGVEKGMFIDELLATVNEQGIK